MWIQILEPQSYGSATMVMTPLLPVAMIRFFFTGSGLPLKEDLIRPSLVLYLRKFERKKNRVVVRGRIRFRSEKYRIQHVRYYWIRIHTTGYYNAI